MTDCHICFTAWIYIPSLSHGVGLKLKLHLLLPWRLDIYLQVLMQSFLDFHIVLKSAMFRTKISKGNSDLPVKSERQSTKSTIMALKLLLKGQFFK